MAGGKKEKEKLGKHGLFCVLDMCVGIRNQALWNMY